MTNREKYNFFEEELKNIVIKALEKEKFIRINDSIYIFKNTSEDILVNKADWPYSKLFVSQDIEFKIFIADEINNKQKI